MKKLTDTEAIQILVNYADTMAREHGTPCDGITECGECYLCTEFETVPAAMTALGFKAQGERWAKVLKKAGMKP